MEDCTRHGVCVRLIKGAVSVMRDPKTNQCILNPETNQYDMCPFGYVPDCRTAGQCISTLYIGDWICDSSNPLCAGGLEPDFPHDLTCYPQEKWKKKWSK